ncbi:efflux RND transporter permease subunit [Actinoallomurus sp. NPDC050550]|uniref:MMPL family transporter n=1 Tax=Actinoallomurus sp. NPDC050550 TaxID=3154937 RepID=UPI0033CB8670
MRLSTLAGSRPVPHGPGLFYRWAVVAARNHRRVLACWLAAVAFALALSPVLLGSLGTPPLTVEGSASARAEAALARGVPLLGREQMIGVFHSAGLTAADPLYQHAVEGGYRALQRQPGITSVIPLPRPGGAPAGAVPAGPYRPGALPYRSPDNLYAFVGVTGSERDRLRRFPAQRAALEQATQRLSRGRVSAYLVGTTALGYDVRNIEVADVRQIEGVAVPLALIVLVVGLGGLGAAVVPLIMAAVAIVVTLGVFAVVGRVAGFDAFLLTVVGVVGLGVGVDYSLLVVSRYREELGRGLTREHAAGVAVATAGRTVSYSAAVAAVAALSLLLVRVAIFREFAFGAFVVIVVAMGAALSLLPAFLVWWTPWLDRGMVPWRRRSYEAVLSDEGVWARWARQLMRHPWPYLIGAGVLLVGCAAPASALRPYPDIQRQTLARTSSGRGLAVLEGDFFGGAPGTITVLVARRPRTLPPKVTALTGALSADPQVAAVISITGRDVTVLGAVPREGPDSPRTADLVRRIRTQIVPAAAPVGHRVLVGGPSALLVDAHHEFTTRLWWLIGLILTASLVLLTLMLGSLLLPFKAVAMNLVAVGAGYGLLAVCQHILPGGVLGSAGAVQFYLPLLVFAFLFGLSMDYEIFLVRRIQEIYRATGDNTHAVAAGLQRTARPIFLAAAIMVAVFAALFTSRILEIRQFGFVLMVAFAVEATLIRLLLVPAAMRILGRWNWWLPSLRRKHVHRSRPGAAPGAGEPGGHPVPDPGAGSGDRPGGAAGARGRA